MPDAVAPTADPPSVTKYVRQFLVLPESELISVGYGLRAALQARRNLRRLRGSSVFNLTGEWLTVAYRGQVGILPVNVAAGRIAKLLQSPNVLVHPVILISDGKIPPPSAQTERTWDAEALRAFRMEVDRLDAEIEAAIRDDDEGRATRLRADRIQIAAEIEKAEYELQPHASQLLPPAGRLPRAGRDRDLIRQTLARGVTLAAELGRRTRVALCFVGPGFIQI